MIPCPLCKHPNLPGSDHCEKCMAPLRDLDVPQPTTGIQRRLMKDEVGALPLEACLCFDKDATVREAVDSMRREKASAVLVTDGEELSGIVTELDLLNKIEGKDADLAAMPLVRLMTKDVETLRSDDKVVVALNRMCAHGYRHIPVIHEKAVLGVLTVAGLFEYVTEQVSGPEG